MVKAYFVMRKDLNMTPAKLAVQVGHGTQYIIMNYPNEDVIFNWSNLSNSRKVVCEISSEEKLNNLIKLLEKKLQIYKIVDAGYTEFEGETFTGISFLLPDWIEEDEITKEIDKKIKRLQLYK